jgi:hypothetical protein
VEEVRGEDGVWDPGATGRVPDRASTEALSGADSRGWSPSPPAMASKARTPAAAMTPSCWEVTPLTPMAPTTAPSSMKGSPPSRGRAWRRPSMAAFPPAIPSWKAAVGRRKAAEVRAFSVATSTLPVCTRSIRSR